MGIFKDAEIESIRRELAGLTGPVKLINFTQELECNYCRETNQIVTDLASISDKINVETYNFITDKDRVEQYNVDKIPATVVIGAEDRGIRFYGIPSGFEFMSLLEAVKMVSSGQTGLNPRTREMLKHLNKPLHIQVLVTPT